MIVWAPLLVGLMSGAVTRLIGHVVRVRIPTQVVRTIVELVAVVVTSLLAFVPSSGERFQNETMYQEVGRHTIHVQLNLEITIGYPVWLEQLSAFEITRTVDSINVPIQAADTSVATYLVGKLPADYRAPFLMGSIHC